MLSRLLGLCHLAITRSLALPGLLSFGRSPTLEYCYTARGAPVAGIGTRPGYAAMAATNSSVALSLRGHVVIAVQLSQPCSRGDAQKKHETERGPVQLPGGEASDCKPIDEHQPGEPACPGWHIPSVGKHEGA